MRFHNFKELTVWKKSVDLTVLIYEVTRSFPDIEKFGLVSQIQRSCVSIASNIAEGCGRVSIKELKHYVSISMGSAYELETQIILSSKIGYITVEKLNSLSILITEVQRMLFGFYNSLQSSNGKDVTSSYLLFKS